MARIELSVEDVLKGFFGDISADGVYAGLYQMHGQIELGRLGMLPRPELAARAYVAEEYRELSRILWHVLVATWGDDPNGWALPQEIKQAVGNILALYLSREASHAGDSRVEPVASHAKPRSRRRGRSGI